MTLFQDTSGDPRAARVLVAAVLAWFGAVGDAAMGNSPGFAVRKASLAVALAKTAELPEANRSALYFAGLLHAVGAIGNPAYRKGEALPERTARMEGWDVPAHGAQICAAVGALPPEVPDMVRWQHEAWDGTGYPDQLRWFGIPRATQCLALADRFIRIADPEEALAQIALASGRAFAPENVRMFTMWFHRSGGEVELVEPPPDALADSAPAGQALLERFADRIDAHNGVEGRWRRVARVAEATAASMAIAADEARKLAIACRIFGAGEIDDPVIEDEAFDPLARLGIEHRSRNAARAAELAQAHESLRLASGTVGARGEWFDGSGKPNGLARNAIPASAAILSAAIAYDRLDRSERIDTAVGTQFDPTVVRVMMEAAKTRA